MKNWRLLILFSVLLLSLSCSVGDDVPGNTTRPDGVFSFVLYNDSTLSSDTIGPFSVLYYDGASMSPLCWSERIDVHLAPGERSDVIRSPWSYVWIDADGPSVRMPKKTPLSPDSITTIHF